MRDYLEREGYVVLEAADGQAALDLARAERPDLVAYLRSCQECHE